MVLYFIITAFNVGNVPFCVIYKLNFTICIYMLYMGSTYGSLLSAFSNTPSRSWDVSPVGHC